jgi:hypothetical protein
VIISGVNLGCKYNNSAHIIVTKKKKKIQKYTIQKLSSCTAISTAKTTASERVIKFNQCQYKEAVSN